MTPSYMSREEIALDVLIALVKEAKGTKESKVKAAFEYADLFLEEAGYNESKDSAGISRNVSESVQKK